MIRNLTIILFLFIAKSCMFSDNKLKEKKDFYNTISGWDIKHVPIIHPFRATSTYPGVWLINGTELLNKGGSIPVISFGVTKNYIYGKTDSEEWFLLNTNSLLYSEYSTETELIETLKLFNLEKNPIETCDNYFDLLKEKKRCYWYPNVGEKYPKFEDIEPDKVYTIQIEGKDRITDFKINGKIKKSVSKIYYFKMKYDKENNDLFHVSFNQSSPKLIENNEIYSAYVEDNNFVNISVYIPFTVAHNNGISEINRTVISRQIKLE